MCPLLCAQLTGEKESPMMVRKQGAKTSVSEGNESMAKRDTQILELLTRHQRMEVSALAEHLGVSSVTIRKDLDTLEAKGLIRREHGHAIMGSPDDINNRLGFRYDVKRRIADAAAQLVQDGETVMIESGSCCALLAEALAEQQRNVTIVTNSAFIAGYIRKHPAARTVLLGGDYQNESQVMVGSMVKRCAEAFFVDKLFVGTDGFGERTGFTGNDHRRAETVRDLAEQASHVVILTDSSKFGRLGVVSLMPLDWVHRVITDDGMPAGSETFLRGHEVDVIKVSG